jgi:hypothetical protein
MRAWIATLFLAVNVFGASPTPQQYITPNPIGGPAYGTPMPKPTPFQQRMAVITRLAKPDAISGGNVMLVWNADQDPTVVGYDLLQGTKSGVYGLPINVGNVQSVDITVAPGTYFWSVAAYNAAGVQSAPSNEVTATISATTPTPTPATPTPSPTITPTPTQTPTPSPSPSPTPSTKFVIGQQVAPNALVNVRSTPGGTLLGTQPTGSLGVVTGGPQEAPINNIATNWWTIKFAAGVSGWVGEGGLSAVSTPTPTPVTYNAWEAQLKAWLQANPPTPDP